MSKRRIDEDTPLRREGFWWSYREPGLPAPIELAGPAWKGRKKFLLCLYGVEVIAKRHHYRGWSTCRCCQQSNGSTSYEYKGWIWPDGFAHYVKDHNVRPSLAFQDFIMGEETK